MYNVKLIIIIIVIIIMRLHYSLDFGRAHLRFSDLNIVTRNLRSYY